ncbi:DUF421 domain-containing protein [Palleronia sp.]|uniref:DUF421 domain-containing protein n=1 Tax=Palleronia sp. TaxID=1940284 RepID=UPI0035C84F7C
MSDAIFDSFSGIGRMIILATMAYVAVVLILRISGKRTLSTLNAFDMIVTVALGSTLATAILSRSTPLLEALTAFATLVGLQWIVAWLSIRSRGFANMVRSEPALLVRKGEILHDALRRQRVTENELMTVIRQSSARAPENTAAVILETDGSFSVVAEDGADNGTAYARAGLNRR